MIRAFGDAATHRIAVEERLEVAIGFFALPQRGQRFAELAVRQRHLGRQRKRLAEVLHRLVEAARGHEHAAEILMQDRGLRAERESAAEFRFGVVQWPCLASARANSAKWRMLPGCASR